MPSKKVSPLDLQKLISTSLQSLSVYGTLLYSAGLIVGFVYLVQVLGMHGLIATVFGVLFFSLHSLIRHSVIRNKNVDRVFPFTAFSKPKTFLANITLSTALGIHTYMYLFSSSRFVVAEYIDSIQQDVGEMIITFAFGFVLITSTTVGILLLAASMLKKVQNGAGRLFIFLLTVSITLALGAGIDYMFTNTFIFRSSQAIELGLFLTGPVTLIMIKILFFGFNTDK